MGGVLGNLVSQFKHMMTPRYAFLLLPLALLGIGERRNRPFLLLAAALFLARGYTGASLRSTS